MLWDFGRWGRWNAGDGVKAAGRDMLTFPSDDDLDSLFIVFVESRKVYRGWSWSVQSPELGGRIEVH